jgi:predicted Zn-dependent protease
VTLERTGRTATLDACREGLRQKSAPGGPFELTAVKQSQIGEMAVMEYIVPQALNAPVNQKSLFGCMVKDDVFADIHVSKTKFKTADQSFLLGILTSAHFAARQPGETRNLAPAESSLALVAEGSRYFLQNQFDKAIGPYQRALDLEKQSRQLESVQWRVLIDNLAMAYGISGKLDESETTLKYGLTQDPTYPMFYFILADNFGERKDLANTMKNLRLALQYKANMIPGEALPDPAKDDSFKAFWQNAEFKKLAGEFK